MAKVIMEKLSDMDYKVVKDYIVKDYIVVQEIGKELFQKMVNEWLGKGYVCIGGCDCKSISANPNAWIFTQALIKG